MGRFSRRSFLKSLGAFSGAGFLSRLLIPGRARAQPSSSRVITVTDGLAWSGPGWGNQDLDAQVIKSMIEKSLCDLTGQPDASRSLAALIPGISDSPQRIGIKVNCVNDDLPTHPRVVTVLAELLSRAGAIPENIVVFDRTDGELAACGFALNTGTGYRVYGSDHSGIGYEEEFVTLSDSEVKLSKILTSRIDHLINVPVLKHHEMADVTLALKNHYGSIDAPDRLHGADRDCCPGISELAAVPRVREITRLVLVDALFGSYRSGLGSHPDFAPMSLVVATDPVAADAVGQDMINRRRQKDDLPGLDARHIRQAAAKGLGSNDLSAIERVETVINPATEKPKPWESSGSSGCASAGSPKAGLALAGACALLAVRKKDSCLPGSTAKRRGKQPNQEGQKV